MLSRPEAQHGPVSSGGGTQASVAPPHLDGPTPARMDAAAPAPHAPPAAAMAGMAPAPHAARAAVPPLAGTMLEPPRSLPAPATAAPPASFATRFEQVPSARGAFSQHGSGAPAPLPIPIDQSAVDWAQTGGSTKAGGAKNASSSPLRLILLAALAVVAVGFAVVGKQLLGGDPPQRTAHVPTLAAPQPRPLDPAGSPDQALMANRPVAVSPPPPVATATPSTPPALPPAATNAEEPAVAAETTEGAEASADEVPAGGPQAEAAASPESRLAAEGARHAIAGRYAEALPVYRELARAYSQNTAYTAMARVLEQKLGLAPGAAPAQP